MVCQAAVGQVVGALAQAKRHGNMPLHWRTSPVEPHPCGHGLCPPMRTRPTLVLEALMSSLLGCLLRTSFGIGIVGGSEWEQAPQGTPASLVDLAGAALEQ